MSYKATDEVKYKELVEGLINDLIKAKSVFLEEYDGSSTYVDLRWHTHLEGLFVDQLSKLTYKVSAGEFPEEAIGEYVMEYFIALHDDGLFTI